MARTPLDRLGTPLDELMDAATRSANSKKMAALDAALEEKLEQVRAGWGQKYLDRVHAKGKLSTWERAELLADPGSEIFPIGSLVNHGLQFSGSRRPAPGGC